MKYRVMIPTLVAVVLMVVSPASVIGSSEIYERQVEASFSDVSVDIENAIANRGFVVDFTGKIGEMLNRTAGDVGSETQVFTHAVTWQFCSAILSRKMVEINVANIAYCPYIVYAYETTGQPGRVTVGFRPHDSDDDESASILETIDEHLMSIVNEATES